MEPLLEMLSIREPVSGERLCAQLNMTRGAVWKRIEKLRGEGYSILSAGKLATAWSRLKTACCQVISIRICKRNGRDGAKFATRRRWTPQYTRQEMAYNGAPHGSLAVCELQTAGRGRLKRGWKRRGRGADAIPGA